MKNRVFNSFMLLAMVGMMFTACKKEYPEPPIQELPIGTVYTISEILAMESGTVFTEDASVYGIVTADEVSGNLYKAAFIQERATGAAIELYMDAVSGVRIGDSIRVYLKNVTYSVYNNLPQLNGFEPDGHIIILANDKPITPTKATISEVKAGKYTAGLVRLENVWFTERNTFAEPNTYGNRCLVDMENPTGDDSFVVRTSNYANFANNPLPSDTGNLVAIASVYKNTWQLLLRSFTEVEFNVFIPGGGGGGQGGEPGEVQQLPYEQSFASAFGTYMAYSVAGDQKWVIDYSTAKMTGYENGTNYVNEDWLISSPVALTDVEHVKACVNYVAQFQNSNTEDVTLQVSKDYVFGSDPLSANWIQMNVTYPNTGGWSDFQTVETSLDEFLGETVTVAIKFLSSETQSRTMEVKYILIEEGEANGGGGGGGQGGDVQSLPYTQSFADEFGTYTTYDVLGPQSWMIDYHTAKMTGYASGTNYVNEDWLISSPVAVVGVTDAKVAVTYVAQYQNSNPNDVTLQVSTDYIYGSDPSTANWTQMSATYPNTSNWNDFQTVETSLNDFIGQNIFVAIKFTSTDSQSRTMEVQSITVSEGNGGGGGGGGQGGDVQSLPYSQSFTDEFGTYSTYDVLGSESWVIDFHTAKMTGYSGGSHANEDWLISSPVALTGVNDVKVLVTYVAQYQGGNDDIFLMVSSDYVTGNSPATANWTQMPDTYPNTSGWTDFQTVTTSLNAFIGQTVTVAIKYTSTDSKSRTIEVQSITVQ